MFQDTCGRCSSPRSTDSENAFLPLPAYTTAVAVPSAAMRPLPMQGYFQTIAERLIFLVIFCLLLGEGISDTWTLV